MVQSTKDGALLCLAVNLSENIHKLGRALASAESTTTLTVYTKKSVCEVIVFYPSQREDLASAEKMGFLKKKNENDAISIWRKRWFILKGQFMYYFKTPQVCSRLLQLINCMKDPTPTGVIPLEKPPKVVDREMNLFQLTTPHREYLLKASDKATLVLLAVAVVGLTLSFVGRMD